MDPVNSNITALTLKYPSDQLLSVWVENPIREDEEVAQLLKSFEITEFKNNRLWVQLVFSDVRQIS
jgi:hypothetical protein